mmetsp:Transcript_16649/g.54216  ORF Transcript_16649/g.54216 Transcript_16649/m.54216 type:complete len:345 (-) Transcript_16649:1047-2081(-)
MKAVPMLMCVGLLRRSRGFGVVVSPRQAGAALRRYSAPVDEVTGTKFEEEDETKNPERRPGHQVRGMPQQVDEETAARQQKVRAHQEACPRLNWAEEIRTMVAQKKGFGVLSTFSTKPEVEGFPVGAVVGFAVDERGYPIFSFSTMSSHTKHVDADPRCALTVTEPSFQGAADARCVLTGTMEKVTDDAQPLREAYLASHPNAFWVNFGDFAVYRFKELKDVSFVGGFARAGGVTPDEYLAAPVDALVDFLEPVAGHMNKDHEDSLKSYVEVLIGAAPVKSAQIKRLDRFGFDVRVVDAASGSTGVLRVPFAEEITDRAAIKDAFVHLSNLVKQKKKDLPEEDD